MKKKFTKERFYKRRAYQLIAEMEKAFNKAKSIFNDAKEMNDAINRIHQKQHELQQAELESGTAYIITGERKLPPVSMGGKILASDGVIRIVT